MSLVPVQIVKREKEDVCRNISTGTFLMPHFKKQLANRLIINVIYHKLGLGL